MPRIILTNKSKAALTISAKFVGACIIALSAHDVLEWISTFVHEHGHGIASGGNYSIKMMRRGNVLQPWHGRATMENRAHLLLRILGGPLLGMLATYIQLIILTMLREYKNNKSLRISFYEGLKSPIAFFTNAVEKGKKYSSLTLEKQAIFCLLKNKTVTSFTIDALILLRMGRLIGELVYGLLPYYDTSRLVRSVGGGDGEKIWKMLLGSQVPTFTGNLSYITLAIITAPYLIGAMQAIYERMQYKTNLYRPCAVFIIAVASMPSSANNFSGMSERGIRVIVSEIMDMFLFIK